MSFKKNLLKKIEIKVLSQKVIKTIGPAGSEKKIDKKSMTRILEYSSYTPGKERDMDIYVLDTGPGPDSGSDSDKKKILVLDNELSIYNTSVSDVGLRKSPTVKEMLNVKNVVKILNDSDVILSKREESVKIIQDHCIGLLDLDFKESDINEIKNDGIVSLEKEFSDGVLEALRLFAEILDFVHAPRPFKISNHEIWGKLETGTGDEKFFGPMAIYSLVHNNLMLIQEPVSSYDKKGIEAVYRSASAIGKPDKSGDYIQGPDVFEFLAQEIIKNNSPNKNTDLI